MLEPPLESIETLLAELQARRRLGRLAGKEEGLMTTTKISKYTL